LKVRKKSKQPRRESVKLDEIMRLLFDMTKETLVKMVNGLFGENIDPAAAEVTKENGKFVNEQLGVIEGDMFMRVTERPERPYVYHIEFQSGADKTMAIRVLRYDLSKAAEGQNLSGSGEMVLYMPRSLVIHIEAGDGIPDEYKAAIVFADGERKEFIVPVLKYWELTEGYLLEHDLYPLLPLKVFMLRGELDKLTAANDEGAKRSALLQAREVAERVAKQAAELHGAGKLTGVDFKKILSAIANLFIHLNERYRVDEKLNEGVKSMLVELNFEEASYIKGEKMGLIKAEKEKMRAEKEKAESIKRLMEMGLTDGQISEAMQTDMAKVQALRKK